MRRLRRNSVRDPGPVSTPREGASWAATGAFPRPLYHATTVGPDVARAGVLSLYEVKKRGLGGATLGMNYHSGYVSTTPLYEGAVRLAALMQARNEMKTRPIECVQWWMDKYVRRLKQYDASQYENVMSAWKDLARRSQSEVHYITGRRVKLTPEQAALKASRLSGQGLGELLNGTFIDTQEAHPEYTFPYFAGLGDFEESAAVRDPRAIGVVTMYARVDAVFNKGEKKGHFFCASERGGRPDKGFMAAAQHPTPASRMDEDEIRHELMGERGDVHYLHIKISEGSERGANDVFEVLVCSQDTTVVKFEPVLDWRTILDPKNLPSFLKRK